MSDGGSRVKRFLMYAGITLGVAVVTAAAMLSYSIYQEGQSMTGILVHYDEAALDVADQPGVTDSLKVDRVLAPGPSWIVVTQVVMGPLRGMMEPEPAAPVEPMPKGRVLAIVAVPAGEMRDVVVPLEPGTPLTKMVSVVLHADRGILGTYEYDMDRFEDSPDKPYFREAQDKTYSPLQLGRDVEVQ